jgi:hypothetical protein
MVSQSAFQFELRSTVLECEPTVADAYAAPAAKYCLRRRVAESDASVIQNQKDRFGQSVQTGLELLFSRCDSRKAPMHRHRPAQMRKNPPENQSMVVGEVIERFPAQHRNDAEQVSALLKPTTQHKGDIGRFPDIPRQRRR